MLTKVSIRSVNESGDADIHRHDNIMGLGFDFQRTSLETLLPFSFSITKK